MISKEDIQKVLAKYDDSKISIGTICSHSALQIFHGAKLEGFRTVGICTKDRMQLYQSFPEAAPDEFIIVEKFSDVLDEKNQELMRSKNMIVIPHGSFVEYVGPKNIEDRLKVPMFGNRSTLIWEGDRSKQRRWLTDAGLKLPREYKNISDVDKKVFVKFSGAKGGRGFFTASSESEINKKLVEKVKAGIITKSDSLKIAIQDFVPGVRYYFQYFYSPLEKSVGQLEQGRVELLGIDKRVETIDEAYRGLPDVPDEFFDYTVSGNIPIVIRESLLPEVMKMGINTVKTSRSLFPPGMLGAFCLETAYHPNNGFTLFEISARIVAGSNLYPQGSPYSTYLFKEPMSTGRRIAREIRLGIKKEKLEEIIY